MGKQFDRLVCEQLKDYYVKNLKEFKNNPAVIIDLIHRKEQFVIGLNDKLKDKLDKLPDTMGTIQNSIFEVELGKVFDERNILREEQAKKRNEFFKPPEQMEAYKIDKLRADVFEQKLNLIEEELNKKGIIVKIMNGEVMFQEEMLTNKVKNE